jgi:hypothetical protein
VRCALLTLAAKLHVFELPLHLFLILGGVVIRALARLTLHSEQVILGHRMYLA